VEEDSEVGVRWAGGGTHTLEPKRRQRGFPGSPRPRLGFPSGQLASLAWPHSFSSCRLERGRDRAQCPPPGLPQRRSWGGSSWSAAALLVKQFWKLLCATSQSSALLPLPSRVPTAPGQAPELPFQT
jgi:hypothetical protein